MYRQVKYNFGYYKIAIVITFKNILTTCIYKFNIIARSNENALYRRKNNE